MVIISLRGLSVLCGLNFSRAKTCITDRSLGSILHTNWSKEIADFDLVNGLGGKLTTSDRRFSAFFPSSCSKGVVGFIEWATSPKERTARIDVSNWSV